MSLQLKLKTWVKIIVTIRDFNFIKFNNIKFNNINIINYIIQGSQWQHSNV
jgi:hypothetical protein